MGQFHKVEDTKFVQRTFNGRYTIWIPEWQHLAGGQQAFESNDFNYEPERCFSMEKHLKRGDVLFDIGVSDGWLSAIYAQFVGAENLCLFEPSPVAWPTVKAIWSANNLPTPRATYCGFASNKTLNPTTERRDLWKNAWPPLPPAELAEEMQFRGIKERQHDTPQITIDDFVDWTSAIPKGISIDVEGAEFLVLQGAKKTLARHRPLVWLSLHTINGAIFYDYGNSFGEILGLMSSCGYEMPEYLEIYGDEHWLFVPSEEGQ